VPTGLILQNHIGFGGMSKSLARPPEPFFSVRLKPLGSFGIDADIIVYGDEATMDFISSLNVLWGDNDPAAYDTLQAGWKWVWNVSRKQLFVTDAVGKTTFRRVDTWSDLCIAADVLESHQFVYLLDGGAFMEPFLLAEKEEKVRKSVENNILWGEFDRYVSAAYHALFLQLRGWLASVDDTSGTLSTQTYSAVEDLRMVITAKIRNLATDGVWPQNLLSGAADIVGTSDKAVRSAMVLAVGKYLMVSLLTASMLKADKQCYEPWMLWQMFQWLQHSTTFELDDTIFDLSPNWGA
jgi:hypothetical protein